MLSDRLAEIRRHRVAQCLLTGRADADACFEHLAWRLARTESRQVDFTCDDLERPVDIAVELDLVHLDVQLDFVPLEGFDRTLHSARSVSVDAWT